MDTKDLEKEVLADWQAQDQRALADEVQKRLAQLEAERLHREMQESRSRELLLRPLESHTIFGVALNRVRRLLPQTSPIAFIELPREIVALFDDMFVSGDPAMISKAVTTLLHCFAGGDAAHRREARQRGVQYLEGQSVRNVVGIPIFSEKLGAYSLEECAFMICGWCALYLERGAAREALLREG